MILASLARNLLAGVRLALFLPVRAFDFRASAPDYAALVAFDCVLWVVVAGARAGFAGEFDPSALLFYLATVPLSSRRRCWWRSLTACRSACCRWRSR